MATLQVHLRGSVVDFVLWLAGRSQETAGKQQFARVCMSRLRPFNVTLACDVSKFITAVACRLVNNVKLQPGHIPGFNLLLTWCRFNLLPLLLLLLLLVLA